jgi:hypothetical protein
MTAHRTKVNRLAIHAERATEAFDATKTDIEALGPANGRPASDGATGETSWSATW